MNTSMLCLLVTLSVVLLLAPPSVEGWLCNTNCKNVKCKPLPANCSGVRRLCQCCAQCARKLGESCSFRQDAPRCAYGLYCNGNRRHYTCKFMRRG